MKATLALSAALVFLSFNVVAQTGDSASALVESRRGATRPSARRGHVLIYDEKLRKVILLDGYTKPYQPDLGEVWSWSGKRWKLIPSAGPSARSLSGAVFDSRRKRIVMYGGVGNKGYEDLRGDTWEWDGKRWLQMTDTSVGTRDHHALAYDAARGKTVMYGGVSSNRSLPAQDWVFPTDTWEWDGKRWTKVSAPGPGDRVHFAMAYDANRKQVILFGGSKGGLRCNDTWVWDGQTWRKVSDGGPEPRARHRMAFDSRRGVVILYGGDGVNTEPEGGFRVLEDTWQWDGNRWTEIKTTGPGKRFMHAMAYDSARSRVVLYGGGDGSKTLDDPWEWDGKRWERRN